MVRISKVTRVAIAAALAVSAVAAFGAPAGAGSPLTGSLTANGSGGVTVEWSGPPESYLVFILEEGTECPVGTVLDPFTGETPVGTLGAIPGGLAGPTPITIEVGTEIFGELGPTALTAGVYQFCLGQIVAVEGSEAPGYASADELEAELSVPAPTTTAAPTTTTTEAAAAPAAPRYTG